MTTPDDPRRDPIREARRQWIAHGWADAADGMAMVTSLIRVQQLLLERIDAVLRPLELTFARYEVLMLLSFARTGSLPMARVGSLLQVHPTSATSAVARLEAQGWVVRSRSAADGRVVLATVTQEGRDVADRATEGLNREVFSRPGLPLEQVERLTALLEEHRRAAGDL